MNDDVQTELKVIVEQAVRPVRASMSRKRRMREELLGHLITIYDAELGRLEDDEAALEQARRRFGDPGELTKELRGALSSWDRIGYVLDLERYRSGEPVLRLAFRHLAISVFAMTLVLLLMLPTIWLRGRINEIGGVLHVVLVIGCVIPGFSFSLSLFVYRMGEVLCGRASECPLRTMVLYCLASLLIFPLFFFLTYWGLLGTLTAGLSGFALGCIVAPAAPLLFFMLARQMREEILHDTEWADIHIEE